MRAVFTGKYKVTCPECGVAVVTAYLEALVWEHCPGCRRHIWDRYDMLLADECASGTCNVARGASGLQA